VLLFFAGLFVAVEGLTRSGATQWFFERYPLVEPCSTGAWRASGLFLVGSNVVSNVPFILVVQDELTKFSNPVLAWELLAMASTFAGNLTLLGSVANVIVAERAAKSAAWASSPTSRSAPRSPCSRPPSARPGSFSCTAEAELVSQGDGTSPRRPDTRRPWSGEGECGR
jgi:hypothetical protein